jgi:KDO2-lipid IV(A) lauroyltransferase
MMTRLALFAMWLLHWLPFPLLAACGRFFGHAFYLLGRWRRHVALTNLGLCFPTLDATQKSALARRHFAAFGRAFLERGLLWWAAPERIRRVVQLAGREHLDARRDRPVILFAPHFVGLDMGLTRIAMEADIVCIYAQQNNPVFNDRLYRGRMRFGQAEMLSRRDGARPALRALKAGKPLYYLPDLDYGGEDAIFAEFFGIPAATITGLPRLARLAGAVVLPVVTRMTSSGYVVTIGAPWLNYPSGDIAADIRRMNHFIEQEVVKMPEQYYWLHRRFKTRPPGELRPY